MVKCVIIDGELLISCVIIFIGDKVKNKGNYEVLLGILVLVLL